MIGDHCRWLYILRDYSVLTSRLWEGNSKEIETQRRRRGAGDGRCTEVGAGTAVMEMIGCGMRCGIMAAVFLSTCSHSPFILGFHFCNYIPTGGDSQGPSQRASLGKIRLNQTRAIAHPDTNGVTRAVLRAEAAWTAQVNVTPVRCSQVRSRQTPESWT